MTTLQLKTEIKIDLNEILGGVSKLDTVEIERLLTEIGLILAQRKSSSLPKRESELLRKIGQAVPEHIQKRYDELQNKLMDEEITSQEHQELLALIEMVENADGERLKHLLELAQLRHVTLDELMFQLSIHHPPAYV